MYLTGGSAHIVSNTIAFVTGIITPGFAPGSIVYNPNSHPSVPTLFIANNILFSPGIPEVDLTVFAPGFSGTLIFSSNDVENADPGAIGPNNIVISSPGFVSGTDLHLTSASPSITNLGDQTVELPGAGFTLGGVFVPANINLDVDGDSRQSQPAGSSGVVLHRGADQFVADGLRLRYDTSVSVPPDDQADPFGNVVPDTTGISDVALELVVPPNSLWVVFISFMGPLGPELQHAVVAPYGAVALDPVTAVGPYAGVAPPSGPVTLTASFGVVFPSFLEGEAYFQAFVLRPDSTGSFSNRLRVDFDQR